MASIFQNFELGLGGVVDEVFGTHYAAEIYANQTTPTGQDSSALEKQAVTAEQHGAVKKALDQTKDQIDKSVVEAISAPLSLVHWLIVGLAVTAVIVVTVQVAPLFKKG